MSRSYIATMPRSGSAWLANLFDVTPAISTSIHEPIRQSWMHDHSIEWPNDDAGGVQVAVGCDLALWPEYVPGGAFASVVVVDRPDDEVMRSLIRLGVKDTAEPLVRACREGIEKLKRRPGVLTVDFDELFNARTLERIQAMVGVYLDPRRTRALAGVSIQAMVHSANYVSGPGFADYLVERLT